MEPDDFLGASLQADQGQMPPLTITPAPAVAGAATPAAPDDFLGSSIAADSVKDAAAARAAGNIPTPAWAGSVVPVSGALTNAPGETDASPGAIAKNAATGAIKGVSDIVGTVGNVGNLADYLIARSENAVTGKPTQQIQAELQASRQAQPTDSPLHKFVEAINPMNLFPSGQQVAAPILQQTGAYVPQTNAGKDIQGGVEAVTGALGPGVRGAPVAPLAGLPGTLPAAIPNVAERIVQQAPGMTASGALGTQVTNSTGDPLLGMAATGVAPLAAKVISGTGATLAGTVDPYRANLADAARNQYGIPVNATQINTSPSFQIANSMAGKAPFSGAPAAADAVQRGFMRAVSHEIGEDTDAVTPDVLQGALRRAGSVMDRVNSNTTIQPDQQLGNDLLGVLTDANDAGLLPGQMHPLQNHVQNIVNSFQNNGNTMPGRVYQTLIQTGSPLDRTINGGMDTNVQYYAGRIKNALQDALSRSATPQDQADLAEARLQYKNAKTIEPLVDKNPQGQFSPVLLANSVRQSYGGFPHMGPAARMGDLSQIGQSFFKEPKSSGTAENLSVIGALKQVPALAAGAAGAGALYGGLSPLAAIGGGGALIGSLLANRAVGAGLRSNALAEGLINRSLGRPQAPGISQELINQLMVPYAAQIGAPGAGASGRSQP